MISFVVIGRNESWRLEKCLSAIRRLAEIELMQPYEIIYVDSQSTDGSVELAKQYADKFFLLTGECNAAIGRNVGAKEAQGDILFFLDGDMELLDGVLSSIFEKGNFLPYPFLSGIENEHLYDNDWNLVEIKSRRNYLKGQKWFENVTGGLFIVEKAYWNQVGGMDNRFKKNQDYEFGLRMTNNGCPLCRIGKIWVNHYTRYYAIRTDLSTVCKYQAMLTRKYGFRSFAFKTLFIGHYSAFLLMMSIIALILIRDLCTLIPYLIVLLYRTTRIIQRTPIATDFVKVAWQRFIKDVLFIYHFLTFYPNQPEVKYRCVK